MQIVSGSRDKTIKLWNTLGECKFTIAEGEGHTEWVSCVRFSPVTNKPIIVSAGWDRLVKVWNLTNCKLKGDLRGHRYYINTVTVSPDGSLCASGGKVRLLFPPCSCGKTEVRLGIHTEKRLAKVASICDLSALRCYLLTRAGKLSLATGRVVRAGESRKGLTSNWVIWMICGCAGWNSHALGSGRRQEAVQLGSQ